MLKIIEQYQEVIQQGLGIGLFFAYALLFCISPVLVPPYLGNSALMHIVFLGILLILFVVIFVLQRARGFNLATLFRKKRSQGALLSGAIISGGSACMWLPQSFPMLILTSLLMSFGAVTLLLLWAHATSAQQLRLRVASCGFAGITSALLYLTIVCIPDPINTLFACLLPLASGAMGFILWHKHEPIQLERNAFTNRKGKKPGKGKTASSWSLSPLDPRLSCAVFCLGSLFSLAGYALLQGHDMTNPPILPGILCIGLFLVAQIALAVYMSRIIHVESPRAAYKPVPILFAIGFLLLATDLPLIVMISMALAFAGFGCFMVYYWIVLGNNVSRYRSVCEDVYSFGFFVLIAGVLFGEIVKMALDYFGTMQLSYSIALSLIGLFILVFLLWQMADGAVFADETREMGGSYSAEPEVVLTDTTERAEALTKYFGLSPREQDVVQLLISGHTAPAICKELYLSIHTVKTHIKHIYRKTGVSKRQQLIALSNELLQA
jgi:DNA-binding CsgD family transcriptional regulator